VLDRPGGVLTFAFLLFDTPDAREFPPDWIACGGQGRKIAVPTK